MSNLLVSIVIPVYNGTNYLREAIDSALAQTYDNCEIIVVNDGSTDDTERICLSYGDCLRYFRKENGGVATALNLGIKQMRGEYFSWLSHDDIYYPWKVEKQIEALRRCGDMTKVVFGDFDVLYQDTGKRTLFILKERCDEVLLTKSTYPVVRSLIGGCAMLVHISHFERIGHFNPGLRYVQDYDMWFRMLHNRQSIYVNELMYTVRNHNLQGTQAQRESMKPEEIKLWEMYVEELSDDEMANIYGSKFLFLFEMWFRINAYQRPSKALCEKLRQEAEVGCVARALEKVFNLVCKGRNLPIAIFGAGVQGLRMYYLLRLTKFGVSYFIDNSLQKKGTEIINSIICKSANDIINEKESLLVIIAIDENADVIRQLDLAGFRYTVTHKQLEEGLKT